MLSKCTQTDPPQELDYNSYIAEINYTNSFDCKFNIHPLSIWGSSLTGFSLPIFAVGLVILITLCTDHTKTPHTDLRGLLAYLVYNHTNILGVHTDLMAHVRWCIILATPFDTPSLRFITFTMSQHKTPSVHRDQITNVCVPVAIWTRTRLPS